MLFRSKIGISIDGQLDTSSYGLFAKIQPTEFKRALSNLINNAVEILGEKGTVNVSLTGKNSQIEICVIDNGKGIPPEILAKLGQRGKTHGKQGGSGLGLYHARTSFERWGGTFKIESEIGKGTSIILTLPHAPAPTWFVSELRLVPSTYIIILDDDSSIHGIWQNRFDSLHVVEHGIQVLHFSTPHELTKWVNSSPHAKTALYLADHELIGFKETGLTLIESLKLGNQSILVTSRFEEKQIRENCERLNVRLIPKGMAGFVPITIHTPKKKADAILLDDDKLVHLTWTTVAQKNQRNLISFYRKEDFLRALSEFDTDTPIYIDSNLGDGIEGQTLIPHVRSLGFKTVYLATGYERERFKDIKDLTAVVGKEPAAGLCSAR